MITTQKQPEDNRQDVIAGRNPVMEALRSDKELESIYILSGEQKGSLGAIIAKAKSKGIPIKEVSRQKLDILAGTVNHQGTAAICSSGSYSEMEDIFDFAGDEPLFVLICDGIEDPHNLGALIRTAEASGAHGVIIPKRRSAGLSAGTAKAAAGAAAHIPIVRTSNLVSVIEELKKKGVWFYCADMDGQAWCGLDYSGPVGIVVGSEGEGVSRLVKENCDFTVSLPMKGKINSLNASVAAGIVMYEVARQRSHISAR